MSLGSPKIARREQAIKAARRRLRRLEIETHRIKADLARLEAEFEDDVADRLSRRLRRRSWPHRSGRQASHDTPRVVREAGDSAVLSVDLAPRAATTGTRAARPAAVGDPPAESIKRSKEAMAGARPDAAPVEVRALAPSKRHSKKNTRPILVSLALHAAALALCMSLTFATLAPPEVTLLASPPLLETEPAREISEIKIEPTKFDDSILQNVVHETNEFNIADSLLRDFEPTTLGAGTKPLGDIGQLDALPSDLGSLMAGAGDAGGGKAGGELGSAIFFGTRSEGNRFVFVVDNSSSMKNGRLEMATTELLKTVESLSPRQSFYVIFVSDQTYPMFYPEAMPQMLPATDEHKTRLKNWLPKAILASGKNRELIKAMDMAAALQPDTVFLLWDGDLKYSEQVRMDVMTHLTRPGQWTFTVHTLGMGTTSLDAEYNLTAIANAHRGVYRRVNIPAKP